MWGVTWRKLELGWSFDVAKRPVTFAYNRPHPYIRHLFILTPKTMELPQRLHWYILSSGFLVSTSLFQL